MCTNYNFQSVKCSNFLENSLIYNLTNCTFRTRFKKDSPLSSTCHLTSSRGSLLSYLNCRTTCVMGLITWFTHCVLLMFYELYSNEVNSSRSQFVVHMKGGVKEMQMFPMFSPIGFKHKSFSFFFFSSVSTVPLNLRCPSCLPFC